MREISTVMIDEVELYAIPQTKVLILTAKLLGEILWFVLHKRSDLIIIKVPSDLKTYKSVNQKGLVHRVLMFPDIAAGKGSACRFIRPVQLTPSGSSKLWVLVYGILKDVLKLLVAKRPYIFLKFKHCKQISQLETLKQQKWMKWNSSDSTEIENNKNHLPYAPFLSVFTTFCTYYCHVRETQHHLFRKECKKLKTERSFPDNLPLLYLVNTLLDALFSFPFFSSQTTGQVVFTC